MRMVHFEYFPWELGNSNKTTFTIELKYILYRDNGKENDDKSIQHQYIERDLKIHIFSKNFMYKTM